MSQHAPFSPSAMKRKALCPASHQAEIPYPDTSSPAAITGTHTHTLNEWAATQNKPAASYIGQTLSDHEGDFRVSEEQAKRSQMFLDYVDGLKAQNNDVNPFYWELEYEQRVDPGQFLFRNDWYGTADLIAIQYQHGDPNKIPVRIIVVDYKDGGMPVDPCENEQGICYMLGVLARMPKTLLDTDISFVIIQPKCNGVVPWHTTAGELFNTYLPMMAEIIDACEASDPEYNPGEEQCLFCAHKIACEARKNMALQAATLAFQGHDQTLAINDTLPTIDQMTNEQMSQVLMAAPIVKGWLKDVEEKAFQRHSYGNLIPNHKIVQRSGRRSWIDDPKLIIKTLGGMTYKDTQTGKRKKTWNKKDMITEVPISFKAILANPHLSVAQIKHIKDTLIKQPQGKKVLVHVSEKGKAIDPNVTFADALSIEQQANTQP